MIRDTFLFLFFDSEISKTFFYFWINSVCEKKLLRLFFMFQSSIVYKKAMKNNN